jgi:dienelactone hydrolase
LSLSLNGVETVPAYLLLPKDARLPCPGVLYNHSHGGYYDLGKEELLKGVKYLGRPPYGEALARQGYAVLAIDHWAFGERATRSESSIFKQMLWQGQVMWGMMVHDSLRAFDYLARRPELRPDRIATLGISMGGTMAGWLAAMEPRVRACVQMCSLTEYDALIQSKGLDHHGIYYYVPNLLKEGFSAQEILSLIAPRPHLALAGRKDPLTPVGGMRKVDRALRQLYKKFSASDRWALQVSDQGHVETPAMRRSALAFLEQCLG